MPKKLPILPYSITPDQLTPNARRVKKNTFLGNDFKRQLSNLLDDELSMRDRDDGLAVLRGEEEQWIQYNDIKLATSEPYYENNTSFDYNDWHKIKFDECQLRGDRATEYKVGNNHFFQAGLQGKYRISSNLQIYYINAISGSPTREEGVELYMAGHLLNFPNADYIYAIYDHDTNSQLEILSTHSCYVSQMGVMVPSYYYHLVMPFSGSSILYLEAGQRIDFRVNLLRYDTISEVRFMIQGTASINYIDNNIKNF